MITNVVDSKQTSILEICINQNKKVYMNKISTPLHNIDINYKTYSLIRPMGRAGNSRPGGWV
jgi:hypothetical protein